MAHSGPVTGTLYLFYKVLQVKGGKCYYGISFNLSLSERIAKCNFIVKRFTVRQSEVFIIR